MADNNLKKIRNTVTALCFLWILLCAGLVVLIYSDGNPQPQLIHNILYVILAATGGGIFAVLSKSDSGLENRLKKYGFIMIVLPLFIMTVKIAYPEIYAIGGMVQTGRFSSMFSNPAFDLDIINTTLGVYPLLNLWPVFFTK